jgi:DNA-binding NarL/FixJ family response regulator
MLRLLVADDHAIVRRGIVAALTPDRGVEVVGQAENGNEAVELCRELNPDIAILDIAMPEMNGTIATRLIGEVCPDTRVIIMSMHFEEDTIVEALRSGASGYIFKGDDLNELTNAILAVGRGDNYLSPKVSSLVVRQLLAKEAARKELSVDMLSTRELEVLQLTAEGKSAKAIGDLLHISPKTVDNHKANIMKKLDIHDIPSLVKFAIRAGITEL